MNLYKIIKKLQELSENKKKVVFFVVMAVVILLMIFWGIILTKKNLSKINESLKTISLPQIDIQNRNIMLDFDKEALNDLTEPLQNLNLENTSKSDSDILNPKP